MEDLWSQTRHSSAFSVERTSYRNGVSSLISNTGCNSSINIIHHPPVKRSIQKGCGRWSIFHQTSTYKGLLIKIWLSIRCTRRCDILDDPIASWPFHTQKKKRLNFRIIHRNLLGQQTLWPSYCSMDARRSQAGPRIYWRACLSDPNNIVIYVAEKGANETIWTITNGRETVNRYKC